MWLTDLSIQNLPYSFFFKQIIDQPTDIGFFSKKMDHTEEKHYGNINLLCRVCGNLSYSTNDKKQSRKPYPVEKLSKELKFICGYTLSTGDYYSKFVCFKCVCSIKHCYERRSL